MIVRTNQQTVPSPCGPSTGDNSLAQFHFTLPHDAPHSMKSMLESGTNGSSAAASVAISDDEEEENSLEPKTVAAALGFPSSGLILKAPLWCNLADPPLTPVNAKARWDGEPRRRAVAVAVVRSKLEEMQR